MSTASVRFMFMLFTECPYRGPKKREGVRERGEVRDRRVSYIMYRARSALHVCSGAFNVVAFGRAASQSRWDGVYPRSWASEDSALRYKRSTLHPSSHSACGRTLDYLHTQNPLMMVRTRAMSLRNIHLLKSTWKKPQKPKPPKKAREVRTDSRLHTQNNIIIALGYPALGVVFQNATTRLLDMAPPPL